MKSPHHHGFTLLELIIVLFIFSLLVAFAIPRLTQLSDSVQTAYEREEVLMRLSGLSFLAFQQSREFDLISYPPPKSSPEAPPSLVPAPLELPEGWQVQAVQPIHFFASGACQGGTAEIQHDTQKFRIQLKPPFCTPIYQ
jgi:prepilin-type N-terminal cleavage/methylation domain-containing protein